MSEPAFKDYNIKTRKFVNKTIRDYLNEITIPPYVSKKKMRKFLKKYLLDDIYELIHNCNDGSGVLYFSSEPFCDLINITEGDMKFYYNYDIPAHIIKDVVNTKKFHGNVAKN